ncbi:DcaP family trimeric outer membrane transporter [Acinetobacter bereziniae]|uniref:DcaP family trimeric outer membrane transporter n=1 Tax=Acinetobacter bereziniae TaxID=106648 RepID=UPI0028132638|nr:DcaP family trimeric outer membrane transporter [Acinetobacter bereziniae]MDQ9819779.1 DcaP family trimeric outer membrane transporter [Acinetobacter bereziniae]
MKKFNYNVILVSIGLFSLNMAHADSLTEVEQLRSEVKQLREMIEQHQKQQNQAIQLIQNQPQANPITATNSSTSSWLIRSKAGAEMSLYGNVRADLLYQSEGGSAERLYNQINTVPLKGNNESGDVLKSTLAATRIGLDFKTADQDINAKIEVDFLGANDALRIRHAYFNYGSWLVGQTWSNFAVPDYMPETIDALGYVGGAVKRDAQVRYTHKFNAETQLVSAVEDSKDALSSMRLPVFSTRLNHSFADRTGTMSLRAMMSQKRTTSDDELAWGVGVGAKYELSTKTTLKADYYHVKGDSSLVSWTNAGFSVDANKKIMALNEFDSITLGVTQQFNPQWRSTLGYGYMKADENQKYIQYLSDPTKANKHVWQAWANVFYSPKKPLSFGLEYVYGERQAFAAGANGQDTGEDNRFNAVAMYNF